MPAIVLLTLLIEIYCIIHIIKTGRDRIWLWVILIFSLVGCLAYFIVEIFPEWQQSRAGRETKAKILKTIDPHRDLKRRAKELQISSNIENKVKLAEECVAAALYEEAIDLYRSALTGLYQTDPATLLGLATALFFKEDYAQTKETLIDLRAANPDFKSTEGHLLFARTVEALQETDAALEEYAALATYYPGLEAKCRYALLLKKLGHIEKAKGLFKEVLKYAENAPQHYRRAQKEWIDIAKQQLA